MYAFFTFLSNDFGEVFIFFITVFYNLKIRFLSKGFFKVEI